MPELEIYQIVNILGLILGILFGMIAQKKQFCFSGSIKDYILTKSTKRGASVVVAMITAIVSTQLMASYYEIDLTESVYYKENINYLAIILGGALFGAGMIIADGCSSRHLVKFAQGDSKSVIALLFIGIFAFATARGYLHGFLNPIINNEMLIELSAILENTTMNIYVVLFILLVILKLLVKKISRVLELWDGVLIGLLIAAAWYVTGVYGEEAIERIVNLAGLAFVYPTGQTLELFMFYQVNEVSFAVCVIVGIIIGGFLMSMINKKYSFGCTANQEIDRAKYNMIGGAMMGVGGVMAIGCTVGQGLTGLSTLAVASGFAIVSILLSAMVTAVILNKYHKLPMCFIFEWEDNNIDYQI